MLQAPVTQTAVPTATEHPPASGGV
jgi:hypothetical protein